MLDLQLCSVPYVHVWNRARARAAQYAAAKCTIRPLLSARSARPAGGDSGADQQRMAEVPYSKASLRGEGVKGWGWWVGHMPSSYSALPTLYRVASIEEGSDDLPCSLVLVEGGSGRVIGHARLMRVVGRGNAALVETGTAMPMDWMLWCRLLMILFICSVG